MARGPFEQEIHDMLQVDLPAGPGSMEASEMVIVLIGHMAKVEAAIERTAAEIDRLREDSAL